MSDDSERITAAAEAELVHVRELWHAHLGECVVQAQLRDGTWLGGRCPVCPSLSRHLERCEAQVSTLRASPPVDALF